MSNPSIYNQNGQIVIDQPFTTGESNNKVASAKFVVDTVNAKVNSSL
jgi:carboxypeptidase C (cathepsin A)